MSAINAESAADKPLEAALPRSATRHLIEEMQTARAKVQKQVDGLMPKARNRRN